VSGRTVLICALVAAACFTAFAIATDKTADWLIQAGATFVGALLALVFGIWQFDAQQRKIADKRREELRRLLKAELKETAEKLEKEPSNKWRTMQDYVQPLIIEEAVTSGLFTGSLNEDLIKLAKTYHRYNIHSASMTRVI
jgi:hypothetical protein